MSEDDAPVVEPSVEDEQPPEADAVEPRGVDTPDTDEADSSRVDVPAAWRHAFLADGRERRWPLLGELEERTEHALEAALQTRFRVRMPVSSRAGESREHEAVLASIAPDALFAACTLQPLPGEVWWVIDRALVFGLADRWFGGKGATDHEPRALSGSEQRVLDSLVASLNQAIGVGWAPITPVTAVPSSNATAERFARDRPAAGRIDTGFSVQCGAGIAGVRMLVLPRTLAPLERDGVPAGAPGEDTEAANERIVASMRSCDVPLSGVLAESTITLGDVMKLAPGDFIALDEKQTVSFRAGGHPVFDAVMGTVDGKASASVTKVHSPKRRR